MFTFDANNNLNVVTGGAAPLAPNAAQETGGNLALIATQTRNDAQIIDLLTMVVVQLKLLNYNLASSMPSAYVDQDSTLTDTFPVN